MYLINNLIKALPDRILSAIIDQISLVVSFGVFSTAAELVYSPQEIDRIEVNMAVIIFSFFLNKDIYLGNSFGKYFVGLRVVSIRTGQPAGPMQCLVRNIFLILWPLEAVILVFYPKRRIGDFVAGTQLQKKAETSLEKKWLNFQVILAFVLSFILVYCLFNFIDSLGIMS